MKPKKKKAKKKKVDIKLKINASFNEALRKVLTTKFK